MDQAGDEKRQTGGSARNVLRNSPAVLSAVCERHLTSRLRVFSLHSPHSTARPTTLNRLGVEIPGFCQRPWHLNLADPSGRGIPSFGERYTHRNARR
jgi:hypothetical protein